MQVKRIFDIVVGALLAVAVLPVILLIALLIAAVSGFPVIFCQHRAGIHGGHFTMFKFRTMIVGAEGMESELLSANELVGPAFKLTSDPRVTRLGRWLRISGLDELPQLWNVLRGDMSLVGPRPASLSEVARYSSEHFGRMAVKPGITGLWQVYGRSRMVGFEERVAMDMQYIRERSLRLDLRLLLRTLPTVVRRTGI